MWGLASTGKPDGDWENALKENGFLASQEIEHLKGFLPHF
jgi:hypothetical protein